MLLILTEHHPVEKFQNAGFLAAIVHLFSQIVYGVLIGLVTGISRYLT